MTKEGLSLSPDVCDVISAASGQTCDAEGVGVEAVPPFERAVLLVCVRLCVYLGVLC